MKIDRVKILSKIAAKLLLVSYGLIAAAIIFSGFYFKNNLVLEKQDLITPIIFNIEGFSIDEEEKALFKKANPFGFIIFPYNIESKIQLKALIKDLRNLFPERKLYIAVDQEGGRVDRLRKIEKDNKKLLKKASYYGELALRDLSKAKKEIYKDSKNTAIILKDIGFDINFAPMLDLIHGESKNDVAKDETWSATQDRSYGRDPSIVLQLAKEFMKGMSDGGMQVAIKHIPGLGRSYSDTHDTKAIIITELDILNNTDFIPFRVLSSLSNFAVMGHATYVDIDDKPATLSRNMIDIVRNDIGFKGMLISDAMNMKALEDYSLSERVEKSLEAGIDIVIPNYFPYDAAIIAINSMSEESLIRFNEKLKSFEETR